MDVTTEPVVYECPGCEDVQRHVDCGRAQGVATPSAKTVRAALRVDPAGADAAPARTHTC